MFLKWSPVRCVQLHITLQSYLVSFLSCMKNCPLPFSGDFTEFFTNQFRTVGKAQITAADPRWALALFLLLLMMHLLLYFWYITQLMCLGTCTSLRYGVLHLTHYTNNITENFTMVFFSKKYAVNHAPSKYFIIVNSPWCYTLFTSYTETMLLTTCMRD